MPNFSGNLQGTPSRPLETLTASMAVTASYALESLKLGTASVGDISTPIYLENGTPKIADIVSPGQTGSWSAAAAWVSNNSGNLTSATKSLVTIVPKTASWDNATASVNALNSKSASWDSAASWSKDHSQSLNSVQTTVTQNSASWNSAKDWVGANSGSLGTFTSSLKSLVVTTGSTQVGTYNPTASNNTTIKIPATASHIGAVASSQTASMTVASATSASEATHAVSASEAVHAISASEAVHAISASRATSAANADNATKFNNQTASYYATSASLGTVSSSAAAANAEAGALRTIITNNSSSWNTDTKVTSVANHYKAAGQISGSVGGATKVVTGFTLDGAGHVTAATTANSNSLKVTSASYANNASAATSASEATHAVSASRAVSAASADSATSASHVPFATFAQTNGVYLTASVGNTTKAVAINSASRAVSAASADSATSASEATHAVSASRATSAASADNASKLNNQAASYYATSASLGTVSASAANANALITSHSASWNTDTKVTAVGNHYIPTQSTAKSVLSGQAVFEIGLDAKGHVVSLTGSNTITSASEASHAASSNTSTTASYALEAESLKGGASLVVDTASFATDHYTPDTTHNTPTSSVGSTTARTYIKTLTLDKNKHVIGVITGSETVTNTDTKVTAVGNHYKAANQISGSVGGATKVILGFTLDAAGHVTAATSVDSSSLKVTSASYANSATSASRAVSAASADNASKLNNQAASYYATATATSNAAATASAANTEAAALRTIITNNSASWAEDNDTKVTSADNHYAPAKAGTSGSSTARYYIKTIDVDAKGHVTGVTTGNETVTNTDTKVTSVANHYKASDQISGSVGAATKVVTGFTLDAAGHVTVATTADSSSLKVTSASYANNATSASRAVSASRADSAASATSASFATNASQLGGKAANQYASASHTHGYATPAQVTASINSAAFLPITGGTVTGDLTISNNLIVNGTASYINTQHLNVKDTLILLASGSTSTASANGAGIAIQTASATTQAAAESAAARLQYLSAGNKFTSSVRFEAPQIGATGFTGSLLGTASRATSASRADSAASADSATSASRAVSASYANNATSAATATSASRATSAASADNATKLNNQAASYYATATATSNAANTASSALTKATAASASIFSEVGSKFNPIYLNGANGPVASDLSMVEVITDTRAAATAEFTGVSKDTQLYDGKVIVFLMRYAGSGSATLNLTLAGGTTTGAKPVFYKNTTRLTTHFSANDAVFMVYDAAANSGNGGWRCNANYDSNTTYARNVSHVAFAGYTTASHIPVYNAAASGNAAQVIKDSNVNINDVVASGSLAKVAHTWVTANSGTIASSTHSHTNKAVLDGISAADTASWDAKQDAISDLATIRTNAASGNVAYGWGNHANAGYVKTTGNQAISGAKTFSDLRISTCPSDNDMPYFLGINAFASGGIVRYVNAANAKVGSATSASRAVSASRADSAVSASTATSASFATNASQLGGKAANQYASASHTHGYSTPAQVTASINALVSTSGSAWAKNDATTYAGHFAPSASGAGTSGSSTARYYVKTISVDGKGHIVGVTTGNETVTNTDTKVTAVGNHYTPAQSTGAAASAGSVISGLGLDAAGHVTSITGSSSITSASRAVSAASADNATSASRATSAASADTATSASRAVSASRADSAASATTATRLLAASGSARQPIYLSASGIPVACTGYTVTAAQTASWDAKAGYPLAVYSATNGILVTTNITTGSSRMVDFIVEGHGYTSNYPIWTQIQGYYYISGSTKIFNVAKGRNYGDPIVTPKLFALNTGYLALWFKQSGSYETFRVRAYIQSESPSKDHVSSIANSAEPTAFSTSASVTISYVPDAQRATSARRAVSASRADSAASAATATSASWATSASRAVSAASATTATTASYNAAGASALTWISNNSASALKNDATTYAGHYTPSASGATAQGSTAARTYLKTVNIDGKGHVVGFTTGSETVTNTDRYVNSAAFASTGSNGANGVKMTLTRAGSDTATVTATIPVATSTAAGVITGTQLATLIASAGLAKTAIQPAATSSWASATSLVNASASAWTAKQDAISDLATIRNNAASGSVAYSWGNHASAGYVKSSGVTSIATGTGLTGGPITTTGTMSIAAATLGKIESGNVAYGWGNHASAGYVKSSGVTSYTLTTSSNYVTVDNAAAVTSTGTRKIDLTAATKGKIESGSAAHTWVTSNSSSIHTHSNKTVLDGITAALVNSWNTASVVAENGGTKIASATNSNTQTAGTYLVTTVSANTTITLGAAPATAFAVGHVVLWGGLIKFTGAGGSVTFVAPSGTTIEWSDASVDIDDTGATYEYNLLQHASGGTIYGILTKYSA